MKGFCSLDINSWGEALGLFIKNPWNLLLIRYWQTEIPQPVFRPNSMHVAWAPLEYKVPVNWQKYRRRALFHGPDVGGKLVEDLGAWNTGSLNWSPCVTLQYKQLLCLSFWITSKINHLSLLSTLSPYFPGRFLRARGCTLYICGGPTLATVQLLTQPTPLLRNMGRGEEMGWTSSCVEIRTGKSLTLSQTQLHSGSSASPSSRVPTALWSFWGESLLQPAPGAPLVLSFFPDLGAPGLFLGFYPFYSAHSAFFSLLNTFLEIPAAQMRGSAVPGAGSAVPGGWSSSVQPQPLLTELPTDRGTQNNRIFQ